MSEEEEEREQSKRPKIVDKRISAGGHSPPPRQSDTGAAGGAGPGTGSPPPPRSESAASSAPDTGEDDVVAEGDSKRFGARSGGSSAAAAGTQREGDPPGAEAGTAGGEPVWTPEQEEQARQIIDQIVRTPAIDWVLNSAVNLANVAGTKLEAGQIEDAQLAIDGLAALIDGLSGRLQDAEAPLRQTLSQLQLLYAQRAGAVPGPAQPESQ